MTDLERLKIRHEICDLKARLLRLVDTKDWAGQTRLMAEDYVLDVSQDTKLPPFQGRDAAMQWVRSMIERAVVAHHAHTPEFVFKGDDEVHVTWAMQDRIVRGDDQPSYRGYGFHHDRWVRRNGEWKIAALKVTRLHVDVVPAQVAAATPAR